MTPTDGREETGAATLLVVDDDEGARESLREIFAGGPHRVVVAQDAPRALRLLHRESCDLILLDVEMPGIDGLALCRLLRAQPATKRLPIVVVSARDDEERKVAAFAAGADDFVSKAAPRGELLSRVSAHLEAARRERALVGSNRELGFLADLGRGLLVALEPLQVVRRAAGATYEAANASLCAAVLLTHAREAAASPVPPASASLLPAPPPSSARPPAASRAFVRSTAAHSAAFAAS